jgi:hypothetical protein
MLKIEEEDGMREILFRGRAGSVWAIGSLTVFNGEYSIWPDSYTRYVIGNPETIGQFTGLTDKNRKRIFEGDIVKFQGDTYIVKYTKILCAFEMYKADTNLRLKALNLTDSLVIGTVHDTMKFICKETA